MKVHVDLKDFHAVKPVVTIGTFDGIHLGHQKVISRLKEIAASLGGETVLFTFSPHPRIVLSPDEHNLRLLNTPDEKEGLLSEAGIGHLITYPFTKEFSRLTYSEFVESVLVRQMRTFCLVIGYDHKFGKNREGGYEFLNRCADKYGFRLEKLDALMEGGQHVSSSRIRDALQRGEVFRANQMLGYEYTLRGMVVMGQKLGRSMGFPTANIEASDKNKLIPAYGVYAVRVEVNGKLLKGMMNIGTRPTFNNNADHRSIEVFIFGFSEDIYGLNVTLRFVDKIRDELKFPDVSALVEQLKSDRITAEKMLQ